VLSGTAELDSNTAASTGEIQLGDVTTDGLPAAINLGTAGLNITNVITTNIDLATASNLRTISSSVAGNNALSGTINLNGGVVFSAAAGGTLTVAGVIQDGTDTNGSARRAIHVAGAGTVILLGAETNTGDTFVDSGTLVLAGSASLSGGSLNVFTGATALISGTLPSTEKIYSQGTIRLRGNSSPLPRVVGLATITIDNGGLMIVDQSATPANPVFVDAGAIEFIGTPSNGQIDLTNNQMRTTNDQNTVRQQLQFANIITSSTGGTLGYRDTGDGHTQIQFALPGDADLNGTVNSGDFDTLALNFNQTGKFWIDGDINYDGTVNALDFNALATNYGKTLLSPALGALVPEPSAIALVVMSLVATRRRRF
jgi:autotransporter-associated beta strand protein